jgi:HAD-superfamily hydrolase, subfamily IIB/mannosyl-3-phosphoglycerate phosphatase family
MAHKYLLEAIAEHRLPPEFIDTTLRWHLPLAAQIAARRRAIDAPMVLGVQGTQGSGKSTLSHFLKLILSNQHQLSVAVVSIDDFYLTRAERQTLAKDVHPLLATRGVPGTHDTELAINTITALLRSAPDSNTVALPSFNKAIDDRAPREQWPAVSAPVDVVILEGWCVGLDAQPEDSLEDAVNNLEADEDSNGIWRTFVNDQLKGRYRELYAMLDAMVVITAPSFACVFEWRSLQEQKLEAKLIAEGASEEQRSRLLNPTQVQRFISHYQRLTEYGLTRLPRIADWVIRLDAQHAITDLYSCSRYLVSTDLDGTLLDHYSYDWRAAQPSITRLLRAGTPIIINTSKTAAEVLQLQRAMGIEQPFVVENGSALYLPKSLFPTPPPSAIDSKHLGYWQLTFGLSREQILTFLATIREQYNWQFSGFSDWSCEQVIDHTGLSEENAKMSLAREFSEPLLWADTAENFATFTTLAQQAGFKILQGGRFTHLLGNTNKGAPLIWLKQFYTERQSFPPQVIALGDSQNDADMFPEADFAVAVKSPTHEYPEVLTKGKAIFTRGCGPEGWNEAIEEILTTSSQ